MAIDDPTWNISLPIITSKSRKEMTNLGIEQSTFGMVASNHLENMLVNWDHHPISRA
jgi:hypothetical protein